jgi:hypothetical protein
MTILTHSSPMWYDETGRCFQVSADSGGGTPRQLTHGDVNIMHPSVSPNGRLVAASRIPWNKELRRARLRAQ